ncbi:MAG TPA: hypothetical protein VFG42_20290 [Baekduia sp.]|uniref:hypothetical protein n=1 Tax=Baekduia sp. TaxID=2600305 RepID=UPI002D772603|nr:hypothetical protein [Baekduia sp.]HET6509146.1 hypothetical protein [Baekduia sp.]
MRFALVLVAVLAAPAAANAADTTITFNGLAQNTTITDQYSSQGVVFGAPTSFGFANINSSCGGGPVYAYNNEAALQYCGGTSEFPIYGSFGAFNTPRGKVSMLVHQDYNGDSQESFQLKAFNAGRQQVGSASVPITSGYQALTILRGQNDISYFSIYRDSIAASVHPRIDNFTFDNPPPPVTPDPPSISVGITGLTGNGHLIRGGSIDVTVRVLRQNGSTGAVNLAVSGLPSGVAGTFSPNPVTGSDFVTTATLHLTASATAALGNNYTATVTATPTSTAGSSPQTATFGFLVTEPFHLVLLNTVPDVGTCAPSSFPMRVDVEPGFTSPIHLSVSSSTPTVKAAFASDTYTPGSSAAPTSIALTKGDSATGAIDGTLRVTAGSGSVSQTLTGRFRRITTTIGGATIGDSGTPAGVVDAPRMGRLGSLVRLSGTELCAGQTVFFGGGDSVGAPVTGVSGDHTVGYVRVPFTATSGVPRLTSPDGDRTGPAMNVITFRDTFGFSFANFKSAGPAWEDLAALYGSNQVYVRVNPCKALTFGFVSCGVRTPVPRPDVAIYLAGISDYGENGNCYGLSLGAYRLWSGRRALSGFPPAGAPTPWLLDGPGGPSGGLRYYVRLMMIVQSSSEVLKMRKATFGKDDPASLNRRIAAMLAQGHPAMMSIRDKDSGHAVVAYGLTPTGDGYDIQVYNPNDPEMTDEYAGTATHDDRLGHSVIHVHNNGRWDFDELKYHEGMGRIGAYDITAIPDVVTTPTGLDDMLVALSSSAHTVLGDPTDASGKPIAGAETLPAEEGGAPGSVTTLIPTGTAVDTPLSGSGGTVALLGKHAAFQIDGTGKALTLDKAGEVIGVDGARKGMVITAAATGGATDRTATATFAGAGDDAIGFRGASALTVSAGAAGGTVALTLGQAGASGAGSVTLPALRLRGGETATVRPASFTAAGTVAVTLKGKGGKTRRVTLRSRGAKALASVRSLKAKASGARVTATATVKLPATGVPSSGTLVWQARKGKSLKSKVVKKGTVELTAAQVAARGGIHQAFKVTAPKGAYHVTVTLVVGSSAKGGVAPAMATRHTTIAVKVR